MPVCIGLVSDTHRPERCPRLPDGLFAALRGVDVVLHAGDLGELWVLDELSRIAPLVAVHGNDDTADAQRELPYQQVVAVNGRRILLCHSHHPDRETELASRREDAWAPKLSRRAAMARAAGADVLVYGHSHVPMAHEWEGVLLVNPGAIASGGPTTRQMVQTVARLTVGDDGALALEHRDLTDPDRPYAAEVDWDAGFAAALGRYSASILEPTLAAEWDRLAAELRAVVPVDVARGILLRAGRKVWSGERDAVTVAGLLEELRGDERVTPEAYARAAAVLGP